MSRVILSAGLREDFDRIFDFLFDYVLDHSARHIEAIMDALDVLATSPLIGRPVSLGQRELIISHGASGYLAVYLFDPAIDTVFVLAVRSRRERDYKRLT
jgi:plasmid stabilization system protein ParE